VRRDPGFVDGVLAGADSTTSAEDSVLSELVEALESFQQTYVIESSHGGGRPKPQCWCVCCTCYALLKNNPLHQAMGGIGATPAQPEVQPARLCDNSASHATASFCKAAEITEKTQIDTKACCLTGIGQKFKAWGTCSTPQKPVTPRVPRASTGCRGRSEAVLLQHRQV
jgi:hypothetical protein